MGKGILLSVMVCCPLWGQASDAAARQATEAMVHTVMGAWPEGRIATTKNPGSWGYEEGVLLDGMAAEWAQTQDPAQFTYIQAAIDKYVTPDGTIQMDRSGRPFAANEHQLDNIELGRAILFLYRNTKEPRYRTAAKFLHDQLEAQPRGSSGGFWHKAIYPNQVWLDGAYMAEPFRAEYARTFGTAADFADIAKQLLLMYEHMRAPNSGLLRHGWDEAGTMAWADKTTGLSPEVWSRAMGWYCMALVDVLDWFPEGAQRTLLLQAFTKTMGWVMQYQDSDSGLWWQVMDQGRRTSVVQQGPSRLHRKVYHATPGNFPETSASCMFLYAVAKGVRLGYLPRVSGASARLGWNGVQRRFVHQEGGGVVLSGTVKAAGLGGTPYRSGSYDYYVGEPTGDNDAKGVGAYLLAGSEMGMPAAKR